MRNSPQTRANTPRCSIRVLTDGPSIIVGSGSGIATQPSDPSLVEKSTPKLRHTKLLRIDQLPPLKD